MKIYELDQYDISERNGTYGGMAGSKEGIMINGEVWLVKYPKSTRGMNGVLTSYTTAPLSEFVGSHIYEILGIDVHETILGIRNGTLVVGCKDFCKNIGALREIRTLKNIYNKELNKHLEESISSSGLGDVDINDIFIQLQYNPVLKNVANIRERFWEQLLIDALINNNDRNNGNWGIIYENGYYTLAPVYDNGAAFSNKYPDHKLEEILTCEEKFNNSIMNTRTSYSINGHPILVKDILVKELFDINDPIFVETVKRIIPLMRLKMDEIKAFINNIPESCQDISICSSVKKQYFIKTVENRLNMLLQPIYDKVISNE